MDILWGLAGGWLLAYFRSPLWLWTAAAAVGLWFLGCGLNIVLQILLWLVFFALAIPLNIPVLRRRLLTVRLFELFSAQLPSMSSTEREALEAGTVWWDSELFSGRPDWKVLHAYPPAKLSKEEQAFIDGPVEELCYMLDDWLITEKEHDLPEDVWKFLKEQGFFSMIIPKQYGGKEFSALAHSSVVMKIASRSITAAVTVMVPNSLGPGELLLHYGTEEQKDYYLPRLAKGEDIPCFALTGPEAGSDAAAMPDTGIVCKGEFEGKEVIGILLNWQKRYITLGPVATVLGLAFKLYDPEHLLGEEEDNGITCALIPTSTPGVTIGNRHAPLSQAFMNGPNEGKDVFIPVDWIIGGASGAGQGWRMLMESLAAGRSVSLPALSVGGAKLVSRGVGAYSRVRVQFKTPIARFEGVEEVLARIAANTYMMDAAREMTCTAIDEGERPSVVSAIVKYNLTERLRQLVNDGMDVLGGQGIVMGPRNFLGRCYQSLPISITVEGANILTRTLIIFGQGAIRCHPYVLKEMQAVTEPDADKGLRDFDKAIFSHVGFTISNAARSLFMGLTGARFTRAPAGQDKRYYQHLTRMSAAFALVADVAMLLLGGALKRKEKLSGRLADILSELYLSSATLKRFKEQGQPEADFPLLQWACEDSLFRMQKSLHALLNNFPNHPVSWVLRLLIFPLGRHWAGPSDQLGHKVAQCLLSPSPTRHRLTTGLFLPESENEPLAILEDALAKAVAAEPVERKLKQAVRDGKLHSKDPAELIAQGVERNVISKDESELLSLAQASRQVATQVDDFPADYWKD